MDRKNIATRYQQPTENLLMDIATLAKKTPNLIDLSIGDPDLITRSEERRVGKEC